MIKFSSEATADVSMLDEHGKQLLQAMGKTHGERGVIEPDDIPAALSALRAAISRDAPQHARPEDTNDPDEADRREQDVDLGRRAFPMIKLLEGAAAKNCRVTWGI